MTIRILTLTFGVVALLGGASVTAGQNDPFVIELAIPAPQDSAGGIIVADVDNDKTMDYLVTAPGHLAAYAGNGEKLWVLETDIVVGGSSEREGLPGHNGPAVAAGGW